MSFFYGDLERERWVEEAPKTIFRTDFERDRARILHSSALRRLGAKTQVIVPGSDDFIRTRLTHSLEVAQVGREIAGSLGSDRDIVDAACLAHDLGHPPFGHNGEQALHEFAVEIGGFEGNAQTLRILTRLEGKVFVEGSRSVGLNLTRAVLDATCKYPWSRVDAQDRYGCGVEDSVKFGFYDDDFEVFEWFRGGSVGGGMCVEAQIMDLADDISYSVHDVEDAMVAAAVDMRKLAFVGYQEKLCDAIREWYLPWADNVLLISALDRLRSQSYWVDYVDGSRESLAGVKNMTSELIGRFCSETIEATRERFGSRGLFRFSADLVVPEGTLVEVAVLKGIAAVFVMLAEDRKPLYLRQREVLVELAEFLERTGSENLEPSFVLDWCGAVDDAQRRRVVVDQVASLTDVSALAWYERLVGVV